jgi:hypothetical protein
MVDLYKWGVFIIATSDKSRYDYEEILARRKKYLSIALVFVLVAISIMYFTFSIGLIVNRDDKTIGDKWRNT